MPLRPYQNDLIDRVYASWKDGHRRPCIVLPCGGGKSCIISELAKRTAERGNRVLFLVHRRELCDQISDTFGRWGVDMEYCDIGMVQTVTRRIDRYQPKLIITDENHHCLAESYRRIYTAFPRAYCVGFTATPIRLNGSGLGDINDDLICGVNTRWLIENHYLSPYEYYSHQLVDISKIKTQNGEFSASDCAKAGASIFGDVIEHYRKLADGRKAVCYCPTVEYSMSMANRFTESGIPASHIDAKTPKEERAKIIEDFRSGRIIILCNVDLISEGFDVPDCSCSILLRPTKSLVLHIQQSMRSMRYQDGKTAVILDHVGNVFRHGLPDQEREWSLTPKKEEKKESFESVKTCDYCFRSFFPKDIVKTEEASFCPFCGYMIERRVTRKVSEVSDSELTKVTGITTDFQTVDECKSFWELKAYAKRHGYKPGWVYYQSKARGYL